LDKPRSLVIVAIFVAGTTGAVILVAGAASTSPLLVIEDYELVENQPLSAADAPAVQAFTHVKGFLASIPDLKNMLTVGRGRRLPNASEISLRHFRRDRAIAGTIELLRGDDTVGLFQASVEIIPIDASRFVIHRAWHEPEVVLICVDIPRLSPLSGSNLMEQAEGVRDGDGFFVLEASAYTEVRIPRDLVAGEHEFSFPESTRAIEEVLLLYPSTRDEASNRTQVMRIEPRRGRVTVIAPAGRTLLPFDDAKSPARLLREPRSGRAVGDGIRIPTFVLSEDLSRVEMWLE
jgi:hypothetical protein